jgi:hypothetical protein
MIPGIDMNAIYDGWSLSESWAYYTINVKILKTMTHEQFCAERPNAAREIERASKIIDRMERLASQFEYDA